MLLARRTMLSQGQVVTAAAPSTNVIDRGAGGIPLGGPSEFGRDLGRGRPVPLVVQLDADAGGTNPTLDVTLQVDDDEAFASPRIVGAAPRVVGGSAGDRVGLFYVPEDTDERFFRLHYDVGGTSPSYTITAGLAFRHGRRPPTTPLAVSMPEFIGATAASDPPTESQNQSENSLTIPVTGIAQVGDRAHTVIRWNADSDNVVPPNGRWELVDENGALALWRLASLLSEDLDPHVWTHPTADLSRSGVTVVTRGGVEGSRTGITAAGVSEIPSLTALTENALLLGFGTAVEGAEPVDDWTTAGGLVLRAQHSSEGSSAYEVPAASAVATEALSGSGIVQGRELINGDGGERVIGLLLEVG